jgi:hypothetical protein
MVTKRYMQRLFVLLLYPRSLKSEGVLLLPVGHRLSLGPGNCRAEVVVASGVDRTPGPLIAPCIKNKNLIPPKKLIYGRDMYFLLRYLRTLHTTVPSLPQPRTSRLRDPATSPRQFHQRCLQGRYPHGYHGNPKVI